jgi:hypothetical protein
MIKIAEIHFLVVILVAGAIGALIGFGLKMVAAREFTTTLGKKEFFSPSNQHEIEPQATESVTVAADQSPQQVEESNSDSGERALLLIAQAESAPASLLPKLLGQAKGDDLISAAVATCWANRFPEDMFRYLIRVKV